MTKTHDQFALVNKVSSHSFPSDFMPRLRPLSFAVVLAFAHGAATAATITVNSNSSNSTVAGACALRDAVVSANTGIVPAGSTCVAGAGGDTIDFNPAVFTGGPANIITFTAPLVGTIDALRVNRTLTIDATSVGGVTLLRSGAPDFRLINVFDALNPSNIFVPVGLTLAHITISGGKTTANTIFPYDSTLPVFTRGAGIATKGTLTLTNSSVSNNSTTGGSAGGGGIYAASPVTLYNSTVSGNSTSGQSAEGGGIFTHSSVTLNNSTVSNNSTTGDSARGGGIYAASSVSLNYSTVSNNSTTGDGARGGGIFARSSVTSYYSTVSNNSTAGNNADGGGIYAENADSATLYNSTVSNNSTSGQNADGGGIFAYGSAKLYNSTVSGNSTSGTGANGGGIYISQPDSSDRPVLILVSTLITNNSIGPGGRGQAIAYSNETGISATGDHNLVTGSVFNVTPPGDTISCDPLLHALSNNGGPTQTHELPEGSCAINAGSNPKNFTTDQRGSGFDRVVGSAADIGAFEVQPVPPSLIDLSIIKTITGGNAAVNDKFSFTADCGAAGTFLGNVFLSTALGGTGSITGILDGSNCTVAEDNIFPTPPVGFSWGSLPPSVAVAVTSANHSASFVNSLQSGSLTIKKTVNIALPTASSFKFTLNCTHPTTGVTAYGGINPQSISIAAGGTTGSVIVSPIAAGSTCAVTESAPTPMANYNWGATPASVTGIPISNGGTAIVNFTNELQSGSLTINETVNIALPTARSSNFTTIKKTANSALATASSFNFTVNCTNPTASYPQSISIAAGDTTGSVTVSPIAAGSKCTVTETERTAITGFSFGATNDPVTGILISNGGTATVNFSNTLTQNTIPTPTITSQPTAIPTLSEWAQIALGFMLSLVALIRLRGAKYS